MKIRSLIWTEQNVEHIARHGIVPEDVEEVLERYHQVVRAGASRYAMRGQTWAGRYVVIFLDAIGGGRFYVVTARDMTTTEERGFRKWL